MRKLLFAIFLFTVSTVLSTQISHAQANLTDNLVVSTTIPAATQISLIVTEIDSVSGVWGQVVTALNFDPLTLDTTLNVFFPDHFFAIDVGVFGGAGTPTVTADYLEGANPNAPSPGLGNKTTLTFVKVEDVAGGTQSETVLPNGKKLLEDISGETVPNSQLAGGFLRMYCGIFTGDPAASPPDPAGGSVFSLADNSGVYDGTLTISATIP